MDETCKHLKYMMIGGLTILFLAAGPGDDARALEGMKVQTPTMQQSTPAPATARPVQKKPVKIKTVPKKGTLTLLPEMTHLSPLGCFIAGDTVNIGGKNFGDSQGSRKLIIRPGQGGSVPVNGASWSNEKIVFTVPAGVPFDDTGKIGIHENGKVLAEETFYLCTADRTMPGSPPGSPGSLGISSSTPAAAPARGASSLKGRMSRGTESKMLTSSLKGGQKATMATKPVVTAKSTTPLKMTPVPQAPAVPTPDDTTELQVRSGAPSSISAPVMADPKAPRSAFGGKAIAMKTGAKVPPPAPNPGMTQLGGGTDILLVTSPKAEDSPLCPGAVVPITWGYSGAMSTKVNIGLRRGSSSAGEIAVGTQNLYEYDWTLPSGPAAIAEGTYTIRVESADGELAGESVPVEIGACAPTTARLPSSMMAAAGEPLQMADGPEGEIGTAINTDLSEKIGDMTAPGLYLRTFPAPSFDAYFTGFNLTSVVPGNKGITVDPSSSFPVADKIEVEIVCPFGKRVTSARIKAPHESGWQARPYAERIETYPFMNYALHFPNSSTTLAEHCYQGEIQTREGESGHISQAQIGIFVEWICEGDTEQTRELDRAMVFNINLVCPLETATRPATRTVVGYSHRCPPGYVLIGTNSSSIVDPLASDPRLCVKE